MTTFHAYRALLPDGWAADVAIEVGATGRIEGVGCAGSVAGNVVMLPGMPNVHSHAFQRALAGRTERAGRGPGTFLSWREQMYSLSRRMTPDDIEAIATLLYVEMLESGYTSVCEFHYLHHGPDGRPHADPAAASRALIRAARSAGIRLTLLPVLYMHAGFGQQPPDPEQAPFIHAVRDYLALLEGLLHEQDDMTRIGIAFHSLRAVSPQGMGEVLDWRAAVAPGMRVHIHVAEQLQEVHECEVWSGLRPVE
ncbi:MAG: amidohydrolase family protein, partial [Gammaproteobacteria bacterium]|nr:amidohydrolase family protein [Gammaproteobacteria bacterium]